MMRPGRKSSTPTANTKPITLRSCAVRLEKARKIEGGTTGSTVTLSKLNHNASQQKSSSSSSSMVGNWRTSTPQVSEERKFRGPIKKRPITSLTTSPGKNTSSSTIATTVTKQQANIPKRDVTTKNTMLIWPKSSKRATPVTIAAGRSRRAIKPNPKYASEDMVTTRAIKNVANLSGSIEKNNNSGSSFEDFYSGDSGDESGAAKFHDIVNKMLNDSDKEFNSDYEQTITLNTSENTREANNNATTNSTRSPTIVNASPRKRGRPRREVVSSPADSNDSVSSVNKSLSKNELLVKAVTARHMAAQKRALVKDKDGDSDVIHVTRKRFLFSSSSKKFQALEDEEPKFSQRETRSKDKKMLEQAEDDLVGKHVERSNNSAKTIKLEVDDDDDKDMDTDKEEVENDDKELNEVNENKKSDSQISSSKLVSKKSSPTINMTSLRSRQRSPQLNNLSNTISKETQATRSKNTQQHNLTTSGTDNLNDNLNESNMPTFTIVNINDIISKKGDALISKSSNSSLESVGKINMPNGRKPVNVMEEIQANRKNISGRPPQTILNHQLANRAKLATVTPKLTSNKPAPRILNAMVAKKTQPVKPTTQNPDDSADESFTLSLDEDDEEGMESTINAASTDQSFSEPEGSTDESQTRPTAKNLKDTRLNAQRKLQARNVFNKMSEKQESEKEYNSGMASDRETTTVHSNNLLDNNQSAGKVQIQRQGNKIIKKITCMENWYVIPRKKKPTKLQIRRNQLEMRLIDLANAAIKLKLPSKQWNSKVTLFQLPAAVLAKSTLTTYTGSLTEHKISEEDRAKYQPSCVMFRRAVAQRANARLPYDRAVIFKNNTFFTNIEGKNVYMIGAPQNVETQRDVEILLNIVDSLSLHSSLVETASGV